MEDQKDVPAALEPRRIKALLKIITNTRKLKRLQI